MKAAPRPGLSGQSFDGYSVDDDEPTTYSGNVGRAPDAEVTQSVERVRPPGTILRGKYELGASIGRGGMGEVFEAVELAGDFVGRAAPVPGRLVAVKVVSRAFADDLLMARLHREAEAARR